MTTTQQPMKLAMKCVYCGSVKHEAREASGTCIQELIYALNDSVKREQVLREALDRLAIGLSPASIAVQCHGNIAKHDANLVALAGACGQIAFAALAATEAK